MAAAKITGGVFAPVVSVFDDHERLDVAAFRLIVEHLIAGGVTGLLVAGTTGEAYTLEPDERRQLFRAAVDQARGRVQILGGTGAVTTRQALEWTAMAADCGCDAACVLTPWFQQPDAIALESYFGELAERARLPLLFYHNPPRTGLNWPVEHVARLANKLFGPVVGIKDSAQDVNRVSALRAAVDPKFVIFSGAAHQRSQFAAAGADGMIDGLVNVLPRLAVRAAAGDAEAVAAYGQVAALLAKAPNFIGMIKQMLTARGLSAGLPRRPHRHVDADCLARAVALAASGDRPAMA